MQRLFFKPWVGRDYSTGGLLRQRVLILGESHYQWKRGVPLTPELTRQCIREQISGTYTKQFWTNIAVAFLGRRPDVADKRRFWDSVVFSNLIQANVGFGPRVPPSDKMWADGRLIFFKHLVTRYKPHVGDGCLGYRLWERLPDEWGKRGPRLRGERLTETWIYPHAKGAALAFPIRHPSAGFNGSTWNRVVKRALVLAPSVQLPSHARIELSAPS